MIVGFDNNVLTNRLGLWASRGKETQSDRNQPLFDACFYAYLSYIIWYLWYHQAQQQNNQGRNNPVCDLGEIETKKSTTKRMRQAVPTASTYYNPPRPEQTDPRSKRSSKLTVDPTSLRLMASL